MADIASAVVAGASALVGAGVGGFVALKVAQQQAATSRSLQLSNWQREDRQRRIALYADFAAAATHVMTGMINQSAHRGLRREGVALDDRQEANYAELTRLLAMVRISGPHSIVAEAEQMMEVILEAQVALREEMDIGIVSKSRVSDFEARFADARDAFVGTIREAEAQHGSSNDGVALRRAQAGG